MRKKRGFCALHVQAAKHPPLSARNSNPVVASGAWHIHENGNGANMWRADLGEDTTGTDTYGWQPIGPECAQRSPPDTAPGSSSSLSESGL